MVHIWSGDEGFNALRFGYGGIGRSSSEVSSLSMSLFIERLNTIVWETQLRGLEGRGKLFNSQKDRSFEKESNYSRGAQPRTESCPGYLGLRCIMNAWSDIEATNKSKGKSPKHVLYPLVSSGSYLEDIQSSSRRSSKKRTAILLSSTIYLIYIPLNCG